MMDWSNPTQFSDYIVYVDESGDHSLTAIDPNYPVFVLAFCIFHKRYYSDTVVSALQKFKFKHFGHDIVVLHERDIRKEKGDFNIFRGVAERRAFMDELTTLIDESNFILIACVIDKPAFKTRGEVAADNPYHYALRYGLEQLAGFIDEKGQSDRDTHVVVECRGKKEDRDLEYEKSVQLKPHIVYLANSSNVKVGVTRKTQVPTRWIDQGAHEAIEIVEVPNRYLAGITEVALKDHVADKTNWRNMLKNDIKDENLVEWRERLKQYIPDEAKDYFIESNTETNLDFPVIKYPEKPKSLNLLKAKSYTGTLKGIKGQYLIFEDQTVFNIRSNEGLFVGISI